MDDSNHRSGKPGSLELDPLPIGQIHRKEQSVGGKVGDLHFLAQSILSCPSSDTQAFTQKKS